MRALVLLNGSIKPSSLLRSLIAGENTPDFVCAVDGGARHALTLGLPIDLLLGDFDSLEPELLDQLKEKGVKIARYPTRKNAIDGELALDEIMARGCASVSLLAGLGPQRPDHVQANLALLMRLRRCGIRSELSDGLSLFIPLQGPESRRFEFSGEFGYCPYVSFLAQSHNMEGLSYEGLAYPLMQDLPQGSSLALSNYPSFFDTCSRERFMNEKPRWSFNIDLRAGTGLLCLTPQD